ncbi:relaxin-3-like [Polyodon spathula]|uniref:relaxin-3-like n=1 Tax=Polyodon spathula TaxID=7913 RepID=UPI001B7F2BE4|nr:relaxin-3-like [Polyodon spathula]
MARLVSLACLGLLLALAAWVCGAQDGGVKLCGREFIRTVVMSCGGARWKRYSPELGQPRVNPYRELLEWLDSDKFNSPGHLETTEEPQDWSLDAGVYGTSAERSQDSLFSQSHVETDRDSSKGEFQLQKWSPRSKRDAGPAKVCCKWGCTKSELAMFC